MSNIIYFLQEYIIVAIAIMFVIVACRIFQAHIALILGDNTPKLSGATSFNPANHIDIYGFICFLVFRFGWAKPMNINVDNFKNKFIGKIIYSLSNAFMCFLLALLSSIIFVGLNPKGEITILLRSIISISVVFGIIDLIPLPPFDGSIFISAFLSEEVEREYFKLSKYTTLILLFLIITRTFGMLLSPIVNIVVKFIINLAIMLVL